MSYTLRGRVETRLAASILPFAVAAVLSPVLHVWWPLELMGVMLAVGLGLDVTLYPRFLPYQPGWLAVPLGLLELGLTRGAAHSTLPGRSSPSAASPRSTRPRLPSALRSCAATASPRIRPAEAGTNRSNARRAPDVSASSQV